MGDQRWCPLRGRAQTKVWAWETLRWEVGSEQSQRRLSGWEVGGGQNPVVWGLNREAQAWPQGHL